MTMTPDLTEMDQATLIYKLEEAQQELAALRAQFQQHQEDVKADAERIAEIAHLEATERQWCDEYDDIIERINQVTTVVKIVPRHRRDTVRVSVVLDMIANGSEGLPSEGTLRSMLCSVSFDHFMQEWLAENTGYTMKQVESSSPRIEEWGV